MGVFRQLVEPRDFILWSAQLVRRFGTIGLRDGAVAPTQFALRWIVLWPIPWRAGCQNTALALDHDVAAIGCCFADKGDAAVLLLNLPNPLGTSAGFSAPAANHDHPRVPAPFR